MIEPAIYAAIGFLIAALLALMAAPAVSRRANRLAIARARMLSPLSETQARAERDALRGQHAVEIMRIEQRARTVEESRAGALVELGRRASQIVHLGDVSTEQAAEIARQRTEISTLRSEAADRDAHLGALDIALRDFERQRDVAQETLATTRARVAELETLVDENRAAIATLRTRQAGLELELADSKRSAAVAAAAARSEQERLGTALTERINAGVALAGDLGSARARVSTLLVEIEGRTSEAAALRRRLSEVEPRLAQADAIGENMANENTRLLQRLAEREATNERSQAALRETTNRLTERLAIARGREDSLGTDLRAAATSLASAEGALRAARAERTDLQSQIEQLRARLADASAAAQSAVRGDQALRQAIVRLGREMARDAGEMLEEDPAPFANRARREPAPRDGSDLHAQVEEFASEV